MLRIGPSISDRYYCFRATTVLALLPAATKQIERRRTFPGFWWFGTRWTPPPKKHVEMVMVHIFWTFVNSCPTTDAFEQQFNLQRSLKIICHRCEHHFFPTQTLYFQWKVGGSPMFGELYPFVFSPPAGLACQKLPFVQWPPPRSGNGERVREEGVSKRSLWIFRKSSILRIRKDPPMEGWTNLYDAGVFRSSKWPVLRVQWSLGYLIILIRMFFFWKWGHYPSLSHYHSQTCQSTSVADSLWGAISGSPSIPQSY